MKWLASIVHCDVDLLLIHFTCTILHDFYPAPLHVAVDFIFRTIVCIVWLTHTYCQRLDHSFDIVFA